MSKPTDRSAHTNKAAEKLIMLIAHADESLNFGLHITGTSEPSDNFERIFIRTEDGCDLRITIEEDKG